MIEAAQNAQFKKPTLFKIVLSSVFSKKKDKPSIPNTVGPYRLDSRILKTGVGTDRFASGIYSSGKEKVFIKTWHGTAKNLDYFFLMNEYSASKILHEKLIASEYKNDLRIPQVKGLFQTKDSLSVVFEYVDGSSLESLPVELQASTIFKCQTILARISKTLTPAERKQFMKRSLIFYLFFSPFLATLLCILQPRKCMGILKAFLKSIPSVKTLWHEELVLAHRDLKPHNVLMKEGCIYMIDCESMVLTLPQYDQVYLAVEPDFLKLNEIIEKSHYFIFNPFLKTYLTIQFAINFRDASIEQAHYLSLLGL